MTNDHWPLNTDLPLRSGVGGERRRARGPPQEHILHMLQLLLPLLPRHVPILPRHAHRPHRERRIVPSTMRHPCGSSTQEERGAGGVEGGVEGCSPGGPEGGDGEGEGSGAEEQGGHVVYGAVDDVVGLAGGDAPGGKAQGVPPGGVLSCAQERQRTTRGVPLVNTVSINKSVSSVYQKAHGVAFNEFLHRTYG